MILEDRAVRRATVVKHGPIWSIDGQRYIILEWTPLYRGWRVWPLTVQALLLFPLWLFCRWLKNRFYTAVSWLEWHNVLIFDEFEIIRWYHPVTKLWFLPPRWRR